MGADQRELWPKGRFGRPVRQHERPGNPTFPFALPDDLHVHRQPVAADPIPYDHAEPRNAAAVDTGVRREDETEGSHSGLDVARGRERRVSVNARSAL